MMPLDAERRPQADHLETGDVLTDHATRIVREACVECRRRRRARGRHMCGVCIANYVSAIRRRHAVDLRLSRWSE